MTIAQRTTNFRTLNPITATTREIAEVANRTVGGGLNSVGYGTFSAGATETTVADPRYSTETLVFSTRYCESRHHSTPYANTTSSTGRLGIRPAYHRHSIHLAYLHLG